MINKQVVLRDKAQTDIEDALAYYMQEAGNDVALRFIGSVEKAFTHISEQPAIGSLRYAYELDLPDLRVWQLRGFPWLVFYRDTEKFLDVWRILHSQRDVPQWMVESTNNS